MVARFHHRGFKPAPLPVSTMRVPSFLSVSSYCPRRGLPVAAALAMLLGVVRAGAASPPDAIDSGTVWFDRDGRPVNAHGGGMLFHDGTYYWYGEIKQGQTTLPDYNASWGGTRVPFVGVSCYSSTDLVHWKSEGNVLPVDPVVNDLRSDRVVERPKVVYNAKTGRFVMWVHIDSGDYKEAKTGVAVASSARGPFRYLGAIRPNAGVFPEDMPEPMRREFETARQDNLMEAWVQKHPEWRTWARDFSAGQMARDTGLFVDDDGTAYQFYASEENAVLHVSRLSADYLSHTGKYRRITFDSREAPTPFKWKGRYYLVTSGCTGWMPNSSRIHSADAIFGEWKNHGSFFAGDTGAASVSYLSQPAFVAALDNHRLLFMADRWNKDDLEDSRYVWLPVDGSSVIPCVEWRQVWAMRKLLSSSAPGGAASKLSAVTP